MKKSKAIIILLCALLVLLGVGYVDLNGVDAEGTASASDISLGLDLAGGVSITYQVVGDEEPDATDMADTIAKLQKRVENYSKEAIVYQEGTDRINIIRAEKIPIFVACRFLHFRTYSLKPFHSNLFKLI